MITASPNSPLPRFAKLHSLMVMQRRIATDAVVLSDSITDDDRVKALEAFVAKMRAGRLTPDDEMRAKALEALVARVMGANATTASNR